MSNPGSNPDVARDETMSARFAHLVMQNTNMALMCLGHAPNPQTGATMRDVEAAQMFIDQLEMIAHKTKGNLTREEEKMLQQSLMHLRLAFVEAVEHPVAPAAAPAAPAPPAVEPAPAAETAGEESGKRFTKKYS